VARAAFITFDPVNNIPRGASFFSDNYRRVPPGGSRVSRGCYWRSVSRPGVRPVRGQCAADGL